MENNLETPDVTFNRDEEIPVKVLTSEEFSSIKTMGGLAAVFAIGAIIPYIGSILSLASIVLFLIAFHKISVASEKRSIFTNIGFSYLIGFVAVIVLIAFIVITFLDYFRDFSYNFYDEDDIYMFINTIKENLLTTIIGIFVLFYIIAITCAYLWKMSLDKTAVFFNDKAFKTAGLLYVIGAATIILCGLGALVNLAGHIVLAVAFFSAKYPKTN